MAGFETKYAGVLESMVMDVCLVGETLIVRLVSHYDLLLGLTTVQDFLIQDTGPDARVIAEPVIAEPEVA